MSRMDKLYAITLVACVSLSASAAHAEANKVVIGDIDDMSGVYADIIGPGRCRGRQNGDRRFWRFCAWEKDRTARKLTTRTSPTSAPINSANGPIAMA